MFGIDRILVKYGLVHSDDKNEKILLSDWDYLYPYPPGRWLGNENLIFQNDEKDEREGPSRKLHFLKT